MPKENNEKPIFENPLSILPLGGWIMIGIFGAAIGYIAGSASVDEPRKGTIIGFFGIMIFIYIMYSLMKVKA